MAQPAAARLATVTAPVPGTPSRTKTSTASFVSGTQPSSPEPPVRFDARELKATTRALPLRSPSSLASSASRPVALALTRTTPPSTPAAKTSSPQFQSPKTRSGAAERSSARLPSSLRASA